MPTSTPPPGPGRVVGIDLGTRRIGVAVSDALGLTAQPRATLPRRGGVRDLEAIAAVVRDEAASAVILGLPLDPDDQAMGGEGEGRAARSVRAFADRLRAFLPVPVELVDESFSTVEAQEILLAADVSRARRREVIDKMAAAIILQRWLDARRAAAATAALPSSPGGPS